MKRRLVDLDETEEPENTLPLINIVFLLLIFFMIAGAIEKADLFDITPPESQALEEKSGTPIEIAINQHGRFATAGNEYSMEDLVKHLKRAPNKERSIEIKADAALDTRKLLDFLSELKKQNFMRVTLLVNSAP